MTAIPPTVVKAFQAQVHLNSVASTITTFLRNPGAPNQAAFLSQSHGLLLSAAKPLEQLGHTKLAATLIKDAAELNGAFIGKVGPGPVPADLAGIRNRALEGVGLLHLDMSDIAKIPNFR